MTEFPKSAMVLAAGLGLRMRPLTQDLPKPLIKVAGRALIDRALDHLAEAGIERAVVNLHYRGEMLREHLRGRALPHIIFSDESQFLADTGGGVAKALALLADDRFFVLNADMVWKNGAEDCFKRLHRAWRDGEMDGLLLVHPVASAVGYGGPGDFDLGPDGRLARRQGAAAGYVFTGIQLLAARLLAGAPAGAFSLNRLYDQALAAGRLFGLIHDGAWMEVGTPQGLLAAERALGE